jgi:phosphate acetyltransferase
MPISAVPQTASGRSRPHEKHERLAAAESPLPMLRVSVAHPSEEASRSTVIGAVDLGPVEAVLVGPKGKVEAVAKALVQTP